MMQAMSAQRAIFRRAIVIFITAVGAMYSLIGYTDSLGDIYELALQNDPQWRAAAATYDATLQNEKISRARLLPQLNAEGSYGGRHQLQHQSEVVAGANGFVSTPVRNQATLHEGSWSINLSQPLFDLPSWFNFKSGKAISAQGTAQLAHEQQELIIRVAEAYFAVLRSQDNVAASRNEELAYEEQFKQAQERFNSGVVAITDVDQARAARDASVAQRITDEGELEAAYAGLTKLTGQAHTIVDELKTDFPITPPIPREYTSWLQQALKQNQALQASIYAMQAASQNASSRQAEHLPKITGSLIYQENTVDGNQHITPETPFLNSPDLQNQTRMALIKVTVPIFSGGQNSAQARQAYSQYHAALEQKIEKERQITLELRKKLIATNTDVERIKARHQAILSAQRALDATKAGYRAGTRSMVDILTIQRTLFVSARDYANARYDYVLDSLHLKSLAGQLGPQDIGKLNRWLAPPEASVISMQLPLTDGSSALASSASELED